MTRSEGVDQRRPPAAAPRLEGGPRPHDAGPHHHDVVPARSPSGHGAQPTARAAGASQEKMSKDLDKMSAGVYIARCQRFLTWETPDGIPGEEQLGHAHRLRADPAVL